MLREAFSKFARVVTDRASGYLKGFGFVTCPTIKEMEQGIKGMDGQLGHGDYSIANIKVLRMVNTLVIDNEAKHTIEALQVELQKMKAKLQAVEDLKGQSGTNIGSCCIFGEWSLCYIVHLSSFSSYNEWHL
ncbi:uncharacterized protein LOC131221430 [Magnolia sinica]|uniref:uncharacterized protein LOC131221430 n=1 Tax=Magnolia sinica TaxID=86752 RepID=UPI00265930CA|nr:uncharacterized protein LOC131221430 [Magnolia sinica]